jgi:hypothetical protein
MSKEVETKRITSSYDGIAYECSKVVALGGLSVIKAQTGNGTRYFTMEEIFMESPLLGARAGAWAAAAEYQRLYNVWDNSKQFPSKETPFFKKKVAVQGYAEPPEAPTPICPALRFEAYDQVIPDVVWPSGRNHEEMGEVIADLFYEREEQCAQEMRATFARTQREWPLCECSGLPMQFDAYPVDFWDGHGHGRRKLEAVLYCSSDYEKGEDDE